MGKAQSSSINSAIGQMIVNRKFTVARQGKDITLVKMVGKRPVTINLKATPGGFWIENPERDDRCVNSFLDYSMTPKRVTRNKDVIKQLVMQLQQTSLWDHIENKDFFKVNEQNKKANKKVVQALFKSIRG